MNPLFTDIIGEEIKIMKASDINVVGISGIVIDETKNTLKIRSKGDKVIQKKMTVVMLKNQTVKMDDIKFRPEEKIKKIRRRGRL